MRGARATPARLGMPHLTRAWQMLLKGLKEIELHADPLMAAEMVLIRLAYAASLPSGEDLVQACPRRRAPQPRERASGAPAERRASRRTVEDGQLAVAVKPERAHADGAHDRSSAIRLTSATSSRSSARSATSSSRASSRRWCGPSAWARARSNLRSKPRRPPGLPGELARKLEAWTGMRWMVLVAQDGGEKPLAQQSTRSARHAVPRGPRASRCAGDPEALPRRRDRRCARLRCRPSDGRRHSSRKG